MAGDEPGARSRRSLEVFGGKKAIDEAIGLAGLLNDDGLPQIMNRWGSHIVERPLARRGIGVMSTATL